MKIIKRWLLKLESWLLRKLITTHPIYRSLKNCKALKFIVHTERTSYVFVVANTGCLCAALPDALAALRRDLEKQTKKRVLWSLVIKTEAEFEEILSLERMIR